VGQNTDVGSCPGLGHTREVDTFSAPLLDQAANHETFNEGCVVVDGPMPCTAASRISPTIVLVWHGRRRVVTVGSSALGGE
jgi:hypothetical protein